MPSKTRPTENKAPKTKVRILISPEYPGIKNPTTADAKSIFDKSTKYFESASICRFVNLFAVLLRIGILYQVY